MTDLDRKILPTSLAVRAPLFGVHTIYHLAYENPTVVVSISTTSRLDMLRKFSS